MRVANECFQVQCCDEIYVVLDEDWIKQRQMQQSIETEIVVKAPGGRSRC